MELYRLEQPITFVRSNPTEPEECVIKVPEKAALLNLLKTGEDKWGTLMKFVRARSLESSMGPGEKAETLGLLDVPAGRGR
jgi:hypothetical protein